MSDGKIAGAVIGSIAGAAVFAALVLLIVRRSRRPSTPPSSDTDPINQLVDDVDGGDASGPTRTLTAPNRMHRSAFNSVAGSASRQQLDQHAGPYAVLPEQDMPTHHGQQVDASLPGLNSSRVLPLQDAVLPALDGQALMQDAPEKVAPASEQYAVRLPRRVTDSLVYKKQALNSSLQRWADTMTHGNHAADAVQLTAIGGIKLPSKYQLDSTPATGKRTVRRSKKQPLRKFASFSGGVRATVDQNVQTLIDSSRAAMLQSQQHTQDATARHQELVRLAMLPPAQKPAPITVGVDTSTNVVVMSVADFNKMHAAATAAATAPVPPLHVVPEAAPTGPLTSVPVRLSPTAGKKAPPPLALAPVDFTPKQLGRKLKKRRASATKVPQASAPNGFAAVFAQPLSPRLGTAQGIDFNPQASPDAAEDDGWDRVIDGTATKPLLPAFGGVFEEMGDKSIIMMQDALEQEKMKRKLQSLHSAISPRVSRGKSADRAPLLSTSAPAGAVLY